MYKTTVSLLNRRAALYEPSVYNKGRISGFRAGAPERLIYAVLLTGHSGTAFLLYAPLYGPRPARLQCVHSK